MTTGRMIPTAAAAVFAAMMSTGAAAPPLIPVTTPMSPPGWAYLEHDLLEENARWVEMFAGTYLDPQTGRLECVEHWGGKDGPDDAAENYYNWPLLYVLGAPERTLDLFEFAWEGHLRQYGTLGMFYREFNPSFDWEHNGEGLAAFLLLPLADPADPKTQERIIRFADFYTGRDETVDNYDPEHKIIRSILNGSKGAKLSATPEYWGDYGDNHSFRDSGDWSNTAGDVPMNMHITSLVTNAWILTGDDHYRDWVLSYMDAWRDRARANSGMIPSIVDLDGTVGGGWDGKWYGGLMGWDWTFGGWFILGRGARIGFANAWFAGGGDGDYLDTLRRQGALLLENRVKANDGSLIFQNKYGANGWYNPIPRPSHMSAIFEGLFADLALFSLENGDRERLYDSCQLAFDDRRGPIDWNYQYENGRYQGGNEVTWIQFLQGDYPEYPVKTLNDAMDRLRYNTLALHADTSTPDTRLADTPHALRAPGGPLAIVGASTRALVELTMGGQQPMWSGALLYCQLRYFDPVARRPGLPPDIGALVTGIDADAVRVILVNTSPVEERDVLVQGGAYAEHRITKVEAGGETVVVDGPRMTVRLAPGAGTELTINRERNVNRPTFAFPWQGGQVPNRKPDMPRRGQR